MRSWIKTKFPPLSIGGGVFIAIFLVIGLLTISMIINIRTHMETIIHQKGPAAEAAYEMEINLIGTGFGLLGYVEDHDPKHLERIKKDIADFKRYHKQFIEMEDSETVRQASVSLQENFDSYVKLAYEIVAVKDIQSKDMLTLLANKKKMDDLLDEKIQASVKPDTPDAYKKLEAVMELEINVNGLSKRLSEHLESNDPQYKDLVLKDEADFRRWLKIYRTIQLSSVEIQWASELDQIFEETAVLSNEVLGTHEKIHTQIENFVRMRRDMDVQLNDIIQKHTHEELQIAEDQSNRLIKTTITLISVVLATGLLIGLTAFIMPIKMAAKQRLAQLQIEQLAKFPSENPNPVLRISKDGKILFANDAAEKVLKAWDTALNGKVPERWQQTIAEALETDSSRLEEDIVAERVLSFGISPVKDAGYVNLYARDITEGKQAEDKLIDYQKQLKSLAWQLSLAEELERRRIATGIHDDITQSLIAVKMRLAQLDESIKTGQATDDMEGFKDYIGELIEKTRLLAFDLSSPVLYEVGLEAAIRGYLTKEITHKHDIRAEFEDDGSTKPLDEDVQIQLFRSVRELLANIIKHAQAKQIKITMYKEDKTIKISVADDGVGFNSGENDSDSDLTKGFGLFSIRENLSQLGGTVEMKSKEGQGTVVVLTAPLKSKVLSM